ncbi:MAG: hypothetical protein UHP25_03610 [Prevotella sp.]|nr:hypothetical protein [Prevotella sp.]
MKKTCLIMLATMMGLIVACKPFEENISQFDQNKVYQKDLKSFYNKQCSLWNKFNNKPITRTGDSNSVIGYDEFENDELFQQIKIDLIAFCKEHQDILNYNLEEDQYQNINELTIDERNSLLEQSASHEFCHTIQKIENGDYSVIDIENIVANPSLSSKEQLCLIYMSAAINSSIDFDILSFNASKDCLGVFNKGRRACLRDYLVGCALAFFGTPFLATLGIAYSTYQYIECDKTGRVLYYACTKGYNNQETDSIKKIEN